LSNAFGAGQFPALLGSGEIRSGCREIPNYNRVAIRRRGHHEIAWRIDLRGAFFNGNGASVPDAAQQPETVTGTEWPANGALAAIPTVYRYAEKCLVELMRFELTTSAVRLQRSPI
jgi:hypothetical protein